MFDITVSGAFIAGLLSFLSPCVLPIVPFYLSYLAGTSMVELQSNQGIPKKVTRRAVTGAIAFALGIITIFVGLGASASLLGQAVREYFDILRWLAAALLIIMGLHFLGVIKIGFLYRQFRMESSGNASSVGGAYALGLAFAFGWTPCVGPVLAAILFTAAGTETASKGAWLLFVYGAGMTLPFIIAAFFVGPFMQWMARFRRHLGMMEKLMGLFLILFGVLIATNSMNIIANWMLESFPIFQRIG